MQEAAPVLSPAQLDLGPAQEGSPASRPGDLPSSPSSPASGSGSEGRNSAQSRPQIPERPSSKCAHSHLDIACLYHETCHSDVLGKQGSSNLFTGMLRYAGSHKRCCCVGRWLLRAEIPRKLWKSCVFPRTVSSTTDHYNASR